MTQTRLIALFACFLLLFGIIVGRLYVVASNQAYAGTAQQQIITTLKMEPARGGIYDRDGQPLTGYGDRYFALSIPGESSYADLFDYVSYAQQSLLYSRRNSSTPFLVEVEEDLSDQGIYTYTQPKRYFPVPIAQHLLGYLDGEGHGVAGVELAFDELLSGSGVSDYVQCVTNAQGALMVGQKPALTQASVNMPGVMLTLDEALQRSCEAIAATQMEKGCILVLERETAKVLASVSMPQFSPDHVAKSIEANDSSLLNRAFCQFNVGSVFKPVVAALALEQGMGRFSHDCEGFVDINGHVYRCARSIVHGEMSLAGALERSCNCYFIRLGLQLGGDRLNEMAEKFGFGQSVYLAGGLKAASGNLPDTEVLKDIGQLASISFGQGQLLATPVQVAGMMNTIVNDGVYITPSFLEGVYDPSSGRITQSLYQPASRRVIREKNADALQHMLVGVVEAGIGKAARPTEGGSGGKTGTAQTGRYAQDGQELMDLWFAGFYPADEPRYTIVVLQDEVVDPQTSCAAIFAQVCNALAYLENS